MIEVRRWIIGFVVLLAFIPRAGGAQVRSLGWITGCWETRRADGLVIEQWSRPRGASMFGFGQTIRHDSTLDYEQSLIFDRADKTIYRAHPSGQEPAEFVASTLSSSSVVFANPTHDFPQRVIYRRVGPDSLIARVEGNTPNGPYGIDFRYHRVRCAR